MSYENAPATKMLATHCAACRRPLVDARSVETGMGPECRKKYGWDADVSPEARASANLLVYGVAADPRPSVALAAAATLVTLGFPVLAAILIKRNATVVIEVENGLITVRAPYGEVSVQTMRAVPGRRWDKEAKVNRYPLASKAAVWAALRLAYPGEHAYGPKGYFQVAR